MDMRVEAIHCVPYGIDQWQMQEIRLSSFSGRGLEFKAPFPCVMTDDACLRFHHLRYSFAGLSGSDREGRAADLISQSLLALCSPWDKSARGFLTAYFRAIEAQLAQDAALQDQVRLVAGLYDWRDWLFSAPAALPRAHLYAPDFGPLKAVDESDFVQVALAFRIKGRFVAILGETQAATPKAARLRRARLEAQGIHVLSFAHDGLPDAFPENLVENLPKTILEMVGSDFWRADPVPQGPFAPARLAI